MAVIRIPPELSPDPQVRYDAAAARTVYPASLFLGLLYVVLAVLHPLMLGGDPLLGGDSGRIMSAIAGVSAVFLLWLAWFTRGRQISENGTRVLALVFLVVIVNSALHLYLAQEEWQTTNLMLVVIGAGMAVLRTGWNTAVTVVTWLTWALAMLHIPDANWSHYVIAMGMATVLAELLRYARRSNLDTAASTMDIQLGLLSEAEELAEGRQSLLATISHDVRTPVSGIVGMVDLLLQRPLDARTRELVAGVQHSADGLTTLLNNLLDLARFEAGKLEVHKTDADVCGLISDVLQMVGPISQRKKVPLIGAASPDLDGWIHTDVSRVQQILLNLVSNAVKFTDQGVVTVVARPARFERKPWVDIRVTDTGPGMTDEAQKTVFDMFVQGGPGVHQKHGGSGLGLAIAQRLTTALGGSLQVTSVLGEGTAFRVLLPVGSLEAEHPSSPMKISGQAVVEGHPLAVEAVSLAMQRMGKEVAAQCTGEPDTLHVRVVTDTTSLEATTPVTDGHRLLVMGPTVTVAAAPTAGEYLALPWTMERLLEALGADVPATVVRETLALPSGLRVLLAEDDATNRTLIAEMLQRMGGSVQTVSDGAAAVEEIARDKYDIVLLDLNMPVMDGLEAVKVIRERLADADTLAVLALTADPGWIDRSVLAAAGFNGYVLKPTTSAELHIGITKVLERLPGQAPVQVPAARSTSDITLDTEVLQNLGDDLGDHGLVRDAMGVYLEELPGRLVEIHRGYGEGSPEAVRSAAHALKGASAMLGAQRLSAMCAQMETDPTDSLLADVTVEAEAVEMQMRDYLVGTAAAT
jgi:signal transduction histidine kinase/CheY-like chemotaxis protein